ncbi:MFS transporter [Sinorhizobium meliloti]|nr:MFS transporter [Sinorhizobium meliloti]
MTDKPQSIWSTWFVLLLCHCLLLHALVLMLRVAATYQAISIGLDGFRIGVIGGAFGVLPALIGLHLGGIIERLGEVPSFVLGGGMSLAAALLFHFLGDTLTLLMVASVVLGLGQFVCVVTEHNAIARMFAGYGRDTAFGYLTVAVSLAQAAGPVIVWVYGRDALIPDTGGLFVAGVVLAGLLLLIGVVIRPPGHRYEPSGHGALGTLRVLLTTRGFLLSTMAALVIFAAMDLLALYLPLYGAERGIGAGIIALLLSVRAIASMISRLMFGPLLQLFGRAKLLVTSMLLAGTSIGLLPISDQPAVLGMLMFAAGLGLGFGAPLTLSWISEIAPRTMRASALSLRLAFNRAGQASLPVLVGLAAASLGAAGVLFATSATLVAAAAVSGRHFGIKFR